MGGVLQGVKRRMSGVFARCSASWCSALVVSVLLAGCAASVRENHYFAAFTTDSAGKREPQQFYRLSVDGHASFSNARYLSGFFDERAVSLFFNELKSPTNGKLFDDAVKLPGAPDGTKLQSLDPTPQEGAFVMILSTNADSIANAIGSFAESQVVSDAITRMLNKDRVQAKATSDAKLGVQKAEATALLSRLTAQTAQAASAANASDATAAYLRALTALAQSLGYTGSEFRSLGVAQEWFVLEDSRQTGGGR